MNTVAIGKPIPNFSVPATGDRIISNADLTGKTTVLYFYPKDDTPGCTLESQDFRDHHKKFTAAGIQILGVSRDSLKSHVKFQDKHDLPFPLIADTEETLCTLFDVIKTKNMYGKPVRGIERSTFLIDSKGILRQEWRKVTVNDHVKAVLEAAIELSNS